MKKPIFNYNIEECNALFKHNVFPIGINKHDKTGNVFCVFNATTYYFNAIKQIREEGVGKKTLPI